MFSVALSAIAQTSFIRTSQSFKNGESVWSVVSNSDTVAEFWPIHGINLVTKQTDPEVFTGDLTDITKKLGGIATAPDGMTGGSFGSYQMQGKCLSHGRSCGDGFVYDYGIVAVSPNGFNLWFTHKREQNFDSLYEAYKASGASLIFLPSIMRNGNYLSSNKMVDKVLIRRTTYAGEQIGVVLFRSLVTYDQARLIITGLDRPGASQTTHIYVLDGGPLWGQATKQVNGQILALGTCDVSRITNELVFY